MKAVTKKPTKYTKWCIINGHTNTVTYTSTNKAMATALTVGEAFVSKINVKYQSDPRITLCAYKPNGINDVVAYCFGVVHYGDHTCGKMVDAKTHKHYLANIITGERYNKGWSAYDSIF